MNVLVIGAGSVGQVYGYHLHKGGARVSFYVRPKYVEECKQGFTLYNLNRRRGREEPIEFTDFEVLSTLDKVEATSWDQVHLCIPSTGLYGDWFGEFVARLGDETTFVSMTPGIEDREFILKHWDEERLVTGLITMVGYPAPLPGEDVPRPGTAVWYPPLAPAPFEGEAERVRAVVDLFKRGGMSAKVDRGLAEKVGYPNVVLMALIAELEIAGWSIDEIKKGVHLKRIRGAMREGLEMVAKRQQSSIPLPFRMLTPLALRMVLFAAPIVTPLDLETYLRVHFTKVGAQTRLFLDNYISTAREFDLPTTHLEALATELAG